MNIHQYKRNNEEKENDIMKSTFKFLLFVNNDLKFSIGSEGGLYFQTSDPVNCHSQDTTVILLFGGMMYFVSSIL